MYDLLFSDKNIVAIYKKPGFAIQGEESLYKTELLEHLKKDFGDLHLLYRLDKDTSGILLFSRSKEVVREYTQLQTEQKVSKLYIALSASKKKKKQGWVKGHLEKARRGAYKLCRSGENFSASYFKSIFVEGLPHRLLVVKIFTGKTHQIRVHLKSLGLSILGDSLYGGARGDRLYLHCCSMKFRLGKQPYEIACLPAEGELWSKLPSETLDEITKIEFPSL